MRYHIVTWSIKRDGPGEDIHKWKLCDNYTDARRIYTRALDQGAYVASIALEIESSDYEHLASEGGKLCSTVI